MKKLYIFILFSISCFAQQQDWYWQNPWPQGNDLRDVQFIDSSTGWIIGSFGTVLKTTDHGLSWNIKYIDTYHSVFFSIFFIDNNIGWISGRNKIYKTTNGGINWDSLFINQYNDFLDIFFINKNVGWMSSENGHVYRTIDGGKNWKISIDNSYMDIRLESICFIDSLRGWAAGYYQMAPVNNQCAIYYTTDGGITWEIQYSDNAILNSIFFIDENNGWAVGSLGPLSYTSNVMMVHTTDGGKIWSVEMRDYGWNGDELFSVFFVDSLYGWINGEKSFRTTNGGKTWISVNDTVGSSICFTDRYNGWSVSGYGHIYNTINGGQTWEDLTRGARKNLYSIYFVDSLNGWAAGEEGTIVHTTDGGTNWDKQISGTEESLFSITFLDDRNGWMVGNNGTILFTTDGANNWKSKLSGINEDLRGIFFIDKYKGWIIGANGTLLYTSDGGSNWINKMIGINNNLSCITFIDSLNGWIVGEKGIILYTSNSGTTWTEQLSGTSYDLNSIYFIDKNIGWISGNFRSSVKPYNSAMILKTSDTGLNWRIKHIEDSSITYFYEICFSDSKTGWIIGSSYDTLIWKSIDGGESWDKYYLNINISGLSSIFFLNSKSGWIIGNHGTILSTTNNGITWVEDTPKQNEIIKSIINVYPNPFYDNITIDIIGNGKPETININDLFGRTVLTKQTEFLETGKTYNLRLTTYDFPQGIYFVRMHGEQRAKAVVKFNN